MRTPVYLIGLGSLLYACSTQSLPPPSATPKLLPLPSLTASLLPVARPATPIIIATDTPVPTSVTYVVQPGDTLVGIAVKFGVSVEALQAANDNVQPQFLSIGAVLIIPGLVEDPRSGAPGNGGPVATNAPTPAPVEFGPVACYPALTSIFYCFVEARNPSQAPLENVSAQIILAGADGLPLASAIAYSPLEVIPPGEAAPLAVWFPSAPAGFAAAAARVLSAQSSSTSDPYLTLDIPNHTGRASGAEWTVTGQVYNPSTTSATAAWLMLTLYDTAGLIVGYRQAALEGGLVVGETRDFSISAMSLSGAADHYRLVAEGRP